MLDKHHQSSPRVIEDVRCLPMIRYKNKIYCVVGARGSRHGYNEYFLDLWLNDGRIYKGPNFIDVPLSDTEPLPIEPIEIETIHNMSSGWASPRLVKG